MLTSSSFLNSPLAVGFDLGLKWTFQLPKLRWSLRQDGLQGLAVNAFGCTPQPGVISYCVASPQWAGLHTVYENGVDRYLLIKFEYLRMVNDSVKTLYHGLELSSVFVSLRGRNLGLFTQDHTLMSAEEGALNLFGICSIGQTANSCFWKLLVYLHFVHIILTPNSFNRWTFLSCIKH